MMENCRKCNDRWLITFYPKTSTWVEIECPRCGASYPLLIEGEDEKTERLSSEALEKVQKNMETKYYHVEEEEPVPDFEAEVASRSRGRSYEPDKNYGTTARFLNDTASLKTWDKILEDKFARASFNLSHLLRKKSSNLINWDEYDAKNA